MLAAFCMSLLNAKSLKVFPQAISAVHERPRFPLNLCRTVLSSSCHNQKGPSWQFI
jgi:hypothetical protein